MNDSQFLDLQKIKKILHELNIVPTKRMGQSFLIDRKALSQTADSLELGPEDIVIEIGPGLGALTRFLIGRVKKLIAIEFDPLLAHYLRRTFKDREDFKLIEADVLKEDLQSLLKSLNKEIRAPGHLKVAGNLPYRISTQILFKLFEAELVPERMVLAFQWEVAQRLMGPLGTKAYGALSLLAQFYTEVHKVLKVGKRSFYPEPDVDTGILRFKFRRLDLGLYPDEEKKLFELIKAGYSQRRKTLKNALTRTMSIPYTEAIIEGALSACDFNLKVRAEDLTLIDFAKFFNALKQYNDIRNE